MTASLQLQAEAQSAPAGAAAAAAGTAAAAPPGAGSLAVLPPLIAELQAARTSYLQPEAFFVSWQGVLTLAYSGFPEGLAALKQRITDAHPALPPENPGSKWPKTSLGCLRDGLRLTPDQLAALCAICSEESAAFRQQQQPAAHEPGGAAAAMVGAVATAAAAAAVEKLEGAAPAPASGGAALRLAVDSACVALFESRSLERLLSCQHVTFQGGVDEAPPTAEERRRVAAILAEPGSPGYWFAASRDGNRESHYRGAHLGATLMHPLLLHPHPGEQQHPAAAAAPGEAAHGCGAGRPSLQARQLAERQALLAAVDRFRRRVDAALPGMYVWFSDDSLHITLRALIN